jgi:uncharacterized lipoprotein YddW (UPF0748 family)
VAQGLVRQGLNRQNKDNQPMPIVATPVPPTTPPGISLKSPVRALFGAAWLALLAACGTAPSSAPQGPAIHPGLLPFTGSPPPADPHEFRAAWVANVANIDWPSKPGLSSAQQQAEIRALLDRAQQVHLNAIILQVRPAADAIYPSALEPWTEYLSGTQGQPPQPLYDPLQLWVTEAHRRGLELHAWLNPYRARHSSAKSPVADSHISKTHPEAVKSYGDMLWMDPAEPAAVKQTLDVAADILRRYDVDGLHIDDYFYPYPVTAPVPAPAASNPATPASAAAPAPAEVDFPDEPAWQRYLAQGGTASRTDWRRQQVDNLVQQLYALAHRDKHWVKFGVSPFGLGKPDHRAPGIAGFSQYDKLYANVELWLGQGWLDYLAPQLYWPVDQTAQAFPVLLDSWVKENTRQRHLWPGLYTSRIDDSAKSWSPDEITHQIAVARSRPGAGGQVHFSMAALAQNRKGISDQLAQGPYASEALVPATPWLADRPPPGAPRLAVGYVLVKDGQRPVLTLFPAHGDAKLVSGFAIWRRYGGGQWRFSYQAASQSALGLEADASLGKADAIVVRTVDRFGQESAPVAYNLAP